MNAVALVLLVALQATAAPLSWDRPGANRYTGDVPAAVHAYKDIPEPVRKALEARMRVHDYDDLVTISRDALTSIKHTYSPIIRDMHFGSGKKRLPIADRSNWPPEAQELGLVYHESGHTILVPTICGNVARIDRLLTAAPPTTTPEAPLPAVPGHLGDTSVAHPPLILTEPPGSPVGAPGTFGSYPVPFPVFGGPGGGFGYVLGVVVPTPIPEPGTWALMLLGLGVLVVRINRPAALTREVRASVEAV